MKLIQHVSVLCMLLGMPFAHAESTGPVTYHVVCDGSATEGKILPSIDAVNATVFHPGDQLLFARGTRCEGSLQLQGSGTESAPIHLGAYGVGALPQIHASAQATSILSLRDQQYWDIASLDLSGASLYGIYITSTQGIHHHFHLSDLRVHDVRGALKKKGSGLVVIAPEGPETELEDVLLDGVVAFNTTQWSGVFVAGTSKEHQISNATVRNTMVHDTQGEGIVLFNVRDGMIEHSIAWHTGMQHAMSIGTPNAIWTWQCTRCIVRENEAFLIDSPGVDGGAFDIDFGNTSNSVIKNFGHHTQGYCVAIFGANETTVDSTIEGNTCLANGQSTRLSQRQGAILLMTWSGGAINGARIRNNTIYWRAAGDSPAFQTGRNIQMRNIEISGNTLYTDAPTFFSNNLEAFAKGNRIYLAGSEAIGNQKRRVHDTAVLSVGKRCLLDYICPGASSDTNDASSTHLQSMVDMRRDSLLLVAHISCMQEWRSKIVALQSATMQFYSSGLQTRVVFSNCKQDEKQILADRKLQADGIDISFTTHSSPSKELTLSLPDRQIAHAWTSFPSQDDLWLSLRRILGEPLYGDLPVLGVQATD